MLQGLGDEGRRVPPTSPSTDSLSRKDRIDYDHSPTPHCGPRPSTAVSRQTCRCWSSGWDAGPVRLVVARTSRLLLSVSVSNSQPCLLGRRWLNRHDQTGGRTTQLHVPPCHKAAGWLNRPVERVYLLRNQKDAAAVRMHWMIRTRRATTDRRV